MGQSGGKRRKETPCSVVLEKTAGRKETPCSCAAYDIVLVERPDKRWPLLGAKFCLSQFVPTVSLKVKNRCRRRQVSDVVHASKSLRLGRIKQHKTTQMQQLKTKSDQDRPDKDQTKPNQTTPNQTKPNKTKHTKRNETKR